MDQNKKKIENNMDQKQNLPISLKKKRQKGGNSTF